MACRREIVRAAARLAQDSFARRSEWTVLLIGAGETIELAARHLVEAKAQRLLVDSSVPACVQVGASVSVKVPQSCPSAAVTSVLFL